YFYLALAKLGSKKIIVLVIAHTAIKLRIIIETILFSIVIESKKSPPRGFDIVISDTTATGTVMPISQTLFKACLTLGQK
ncbi:hypothetical protein MAY18_31545, partial [Escherichia coli]